MGIYCLGPGIHSANDNHDVESATRYVDGQPGHAPEPMCACMHAINPAIAREWAQTCNHFGAFRLSPHFSLSRSVADVSLLLCAHVAGPKNDVIGANTADIGGDIESKSGLKEDTPRNRSAPDLRLNRTTCGSTVFDLGDLYR